MIQKYMRGYPVAQEYEAVYINLRLHKNIEFFEDMKAGMDTAA